MLNASEMPEMPVSSEHQYLRSEAMELFELCLTEGKPDLLMDFIEEQIVQVPPQLELLQGVADDLQQRLIALRESLFDARHRVVQTLKEGYRVDLSVLTPANALEDYHRLDLNDIMTFIGEQRLAAAEAEAGSVRQLVEASLQAAAQISSDVIMTGELLDYVLDWSVALSAWSVRQAWNLDWEPPSDDLIH
jgi:hypothetical protein